MSPTGTGSPSPREHLAAVLTQAHDDTPWWAQALARAAREGERALPVLFPALARRLGRGLVGGGLSTEDGLVEGGCAARTDLDAWRLCDAAGLQLMELAAPSGDVVLDLWLHGDFEERTIVLRALTLMPTGSVTERMFQEVQRTNTQTHFEAAVCDGNFPARALAAGRIDEDAFNKLVLKAAFVSLPLARMHGVADRAGPELARMISGLASERREAGRQVWPDTDRIVAAAAGRG